MVHLTCCRVKQVCGRRFGAGGNGVLCVVGPPSAPCEVWGDTRGARWLEEAVGGGQDRRHLPAGHAYSVKTCVSWTLTQIKWVFRNLCEWILPADALVGGLRRQPPNSPGSPGRYGLRAAAKSEYLFSRATRLFGQRRLEYGLHRCFRSRRQWEPGKPPGARPDRTPTE